MTKSVEHVTQDDCCQPTTSGAVSDHEVAVKFGRWSTPAAVGSAILSSTCCWLPLLLLAFGLSAGGVAGFFETVRPFFLAAAVIFLGAGFYFAYLRKQACKPGEACAVPNPKIHRFRGLNRAMLWVASAFVIAFALFPYYSPTLVRAFADTPVSVGPDSAAIGTTRVFHIEGMTCAACAATLEAELAELPGVNSATVSYADSTATLDVGADEPSDEEVQRVVKRVGFTFRPASIDP